jgi:hypothetical protein
MDSKEILKVIIEVFGEFIRDYFLKKKKEKLLLKTENAKRNRVNKTKKRGYSNYGCSNFKPTGRKKGTNKVNDSVLRHNRRRSVRYKGHNNVTGKTGD